MDPKANWRLIACATPILAVAAAWSRPTTQVPQSAGVPRGTIVMWAGAASQVPAGWHTCDGTAGTPDLRDRFVVGVGLSHALLELGGSPSHDHSGAIGPFPTPQADFRTDHEPSSGYVGANYDFVTDPASSLPPYAALHYIMKL